MILLPGFAGGSQRVRSPNVGSEQTINWYPEQAPGSPKVNPWLVPTPGLYPFCVLNSGPCRALFAQDNRMFAVYGPSFYEVFANGSAILRGTAITDGKPATICSNGTNGNQLFVVSGGKGYIYDLTTNVIAAVADADFQSDIEPVSMGFFIDGYFGVLKAESNTFYLSALFDGNDWDLLDVYQVSISSDALVGCAALHREVTFWGSQTTSVWQDTGDEFTPLQPVPSLQIMQGLGGSFAWTIADNTTWFLGQNELGSRIIYKMDGYTPKRVSNTAVEFALNNYPRVSDCVASAYQSEGHTFVSFRFPTPPTTSLHGIDHTAWVYDISTGIWCERGTWDSRFLKWKPPVWQFAVYAFDKILVGDANGPGIYHLSLDFPTETTVVLGAA